jgi:hypothetical protein
VFHSAVYTDSLEMREREREREISEKKKFEKFEGESAQKKINLQSSV